MRRYKLQNHRTELPNICRIRLYRVCNLASHLVVSIKAINRRSAMLKGKQYFGDTSKVLVLN